MPSMVVIVGPSAWTASTVQLLALVAVEQDGARAAVARVAADVRAGQAEDVAEEVHEQQARLDVGLPDGAVDGDADVLRGHRQIPPAPCRLPECPGDGPAQRPHGHLGRHRALVFDRPVPVRRRPALGRGRRARLPEQRVRGHGAGRTGLRVRRGERRLGDGGQADPDLARSVRRRRASAARPTPTWRSRRPCARSSRRPRRSAGRAAGCASRSGSRSARSR